MRLFTGIEIPPAVLDRMEALLNLVRPAARIHWSPLTNLHITTKFIGEWPEEKLEELIQTLAAIPRSAPIPIKIGGLGFFPNAKSPRIFWAGVHAPPVLASLAAETDRALAQLGVEAENRVYSPHLTLARIKNPEGLRPLREAMETLKSQGFGDFEADRFHLYRSKPGPGGSVYSILKTFSIGERA